MLIKILFVAQATSIGGIIGGLLLSLFLLITIVILIFIIRKLKLRKQMEMRYLNIIVLCLLQLINRQQADDDDVVQQRGMEIVSNIYSSGKTLDISSSLKRLFSHLTVDRGHNMLDVKLSRSRLNSCQLRELTKGKFLVKCERLNQLELLGQGTNYKTILKPLR